VEDQLKKAMKEFNTIETLRRERRLREQHDDVKATMAIAATRGGAEPMFSAMFAPAPTPPPASELFQEPLLGGYRY